MVADRDRPPGCDGGIEGSGRFARCRAVPLDILALIHDGRLDVFRRLNADDEARSMSTVGSTEVASGTLPRPPCAGLNDPGAGVCPDRPDAADDMRASSRVRSARAPA
jgi:hypothetical protein